VKPVPDQLVTILRAAVEHADVQTRPDDYVIPNRRPAAVKRRGERPSYRLGLSREQERRIRDSNPCYSRDEEPSRLGSKPQPDTPDNALLADLRRLLERLTDPEGGVA